MRTKSNDTRSSAGSHGGPVEPGTPLFRMLRLIAGRVAKKLLDRPDGSRPTISRGRGNRSSKDEEQPK